MAEFWTNLLPLLNMGGRYICKVCGFFACDIYLSLWALHRCAHRRVDLGQCIRQACYGPCHHCCPSVACTYGFQRDVIQHCFHAVMRDFAVLTALAIWCFACFLCALSWLAISNPTSHGKSLGYSTIAKWLLWLWSGLDGTGIEQSSRFHSILGPTPIVPFVYLGNILFLTILVALLTNKFFCYNCQRTRLDYFSPVGSHFCWRQKRRYLRISIASQHIGARHPHSAALHALVFGFTHVQCKMHSDHQRPYTPTDRHV
jgi:hypothetical protein